MSASPLMAKDEAAAYLRLSSRELERRIAAREVAVVRIGRRSMFTREDLDAFIDAKRVAAGVPLSPAPSHPAGRHLRAVATSGPNLAAVQNRRARS